MFLVWTFFRNSWENLPVKQLSSSYKFQNQKYLTLCFINLPQSNLKQNETKEHENQKGNLHCSAMATQRLFQMKDNGLKTAQVSFLRLTWLIEASLTTFLWFNLRRMSISVVANLLSAWKKKEKRKPTVSMPVTAVQFLNIQLYLHFLAHRTPLS